MSKEEKGKRATTTPGFAMRTEPLAPLEVDAIRAFDDELTSVDTSQPSVEVVGAPAAGASGVAQDPPAMTRTDGVQSVRRTGLPAVDIDLVYERRSAPLADQPWVFVEIWTRNTIYALDARLVCIDVIDLVNKQSQAQHKLRGARLVGGQAREGGAMELSHPFPRPGAEAVFEQAQGRQVRFSQTSPVTRVVLRLRVLTVTPEQLLPTWEEVTGSHKMPQP